MTPKILGFLCALIIWTGPALGQDATTPPSGEAAPESMEAATPPETEPSATPNAANDDCQNYIVETELPKACEYGNGKLPMAEKLMRGGELTAYNLALKEFLSTQGSYEAMNSDAGSQAPEGLNDAQETTASYLNASAVFFKMLYKACDRAAKECETKCAGRDPEDLSQCKSTSDLAKSHQSRSKADRAEAKAVEGGVASTRAVGA